MADINSYAIKFSEEKYATKDDVKKHFNMSSVDNIWNIIVEYRKNFTESLELPSIDRTKFSLVYTKTINNRIFELERLLNKAYFVYGSLSSLGQKIFREKRLSKILREISNSVGSTISNDFLVSLINNDVSTIPNELLIVDNYLVALNYLSKHDAGKLSYVDFNAVSLILESGHEPTAVPEEKIYRSTVLEEPHYYTQFYVYKAALNDRISDMVNSACDFSNDENIFATVRAIGVLYYLDYIMPYEYFRLQNACLAFKTSLSHSGFSSFANFINIEKLMFTRDEIFDQLKVISQKTLDLTYFYDYIISYLKTDILEINDDIVLSQKEELTYESKNIGLSQEEVLKVTENIETREDGTEVVNVITPLIEKRESISPTPSSLIYGEQNVSLPVFPRGLSDLDVDKIVVDLLETYPSLKRTQAHFYARHCTIGKSYTIQQFKKEECTSYETARTSMDYLTSMGFYEKAKLRNKFVYKPVPRR